MYSTGVKILVFFTSLVLHSIVYALTHVNTTATLTRTLFLQCYLDPFRMVKYATHATDSPSGSQPSLLQQRHNVAPGMIMVRQPTTCTYIPRIFFCVALKNSQSAL